MRRDRSGRHDRGKRDGRRRHKRPPRIQVVRDAEEVFRAAIAAGVLSDEPSERNWAGNYLYMFHDEDGTAWFKHRDTRAYVFMAARGCCEHRGRGAGGRR